MSCYVKDFMAKHTWSSHKCVTVLLQWDPVVSIFETVKNFPLGLLVKPNTLSTPFRSNMDKSKTAQKPPANGKPADDDAAKKPLIWDCGSSLYDSFELKSFERQLDSALASRSLSMPHLSDRRVVHHLQPPPPPSQPKRSPSSSSRISRSLQKLLKSVFRPKQTSSGGVKHLFRVPEPSRGGSFYVVYDKSGEALTTIPEVPESDILSPEIKSLVRRTASERFTPASIGISCA
nr:AF211535_1 Avr9/Cf-9 rapidly elicited protein 194 [Ipomoea batatas]